MNTLLMEAYEALQKIRDRYDDSDDPQDEVILDLMDILWSKMGDDEHKILDTRGS